jgi:hypothetical protein
MAHRPVAEGAPALLSYVDIADQAPQNAMYDGIGIDKVDPIHSVGMETTLMRAGEDGTAINDFEQLIDVGPTEAAQQEIAERMKRIHRKAEGFMKTIDGVSLADNWMRIQVLKTSDPKLGELEERLLRQQIMNTKKLVQQYIEVADRSIKAQLEEDVVSKKRKMYHQYFVGLEAALARCNAGTVVPMPETMINPRADSIHQTAQKFSFGHAVSMRDRDMDQTTGVVGTFAYLAQRIEDVCKTYGYNMSNAWRSFPRCLFQMKVEEVMRKLNTPITGARSTVPTVAEIVARKAAADEGYRVDNDALAYTIAEVRNLLR